MRSGENEGADRLLIYAPIGRDAQACAAVLHRVQVKSHICRDFEALVAELKVGAAALLVAEEGLFGKDLAELFAWVADQPAWSDMPFVILTGSADHPAIAAWRKNLVTSLQNVSLVERPVQPITLTSAIHAALRARSHQLKIRQLLADREQAAARLEQLVAARTRQIEEANRELHNQMAERARIEESLRQAQKIEAIGQLTGGVAHDFNNLLMVITGGLDMLRRTSDGARREMLMDGMLQAAQRGAGLIRQLLTFSRLQPLQAQPIDVAHQLAGLGELLDRSLRGDVKVEHDIPSDLWPVLADPSELELVLLNLAVNARDAMPSGGTITIRARNVSLGDGGQRGEFVRLSVIDSGVGMTPEVKAHVFEPFFTTKEVGKGTGLGLAQVYGFVKQSQGSVEIESEVGQGTTVSILLPRSMQAPVAVQHQTKYVHAETSAGFVLLVEDSDEVAALVKEMILELGYQVTRVASARAALGALANDRRIDLVFSDIMMPGDMDGLHLAREIKKRRPDLPVILTSGHAEPSLAEARTAGLRVLPKPYTLEQLDQSMRAALRDAPLAVD
jgi:signal transduction histidine kinase/ActR/RegA family two-component response regulator